MLVSPPWGACHPMCTVSAWWVLPGVLWQMEKSCLVAVIHNALLCSRCIWKASQIIHLPLWHWSSSASWRPEGTENRFSLGCSLGQGLSVSILGKQLESYPSPEQFLQQLQESWVPTNCKCDWGSSSAGAEIVDSPSLQVLKSRLDRPWSDLVPAHAMGR